MLTCPACQARDCVDGGETLAACRGCGAEFLPEGAVDLNLTTRVDAARPSASGSSNRVTLSADFYRQYVLQQLLGRGGMGMVFQARRIADGATVAVKLLIRMDDEGALARFIREGQLQARVIHPNVVRVFDVSALGEHPYLVTEFCAGGVLRDRMKPGRGPMHWDTAVDLASQALDGLEACHTEGIVHRDLKPENLLFDAEGRLKLADLGIAKAYDHSAALTQAGTILGTPYYMSPEQAKGESVGLVSDVYSMGCILYEMLTATKPVAGGNLWDMIRAHIDKEPEPLEELAPECPEPVVRVVKRAMAKRMAERYASAHDFGTALDRARAAAAAPAGGRTSSTGSASGSRLSTAKAASSAGAATNVRSASPPAPGVTTQVHPGRGPVSGAPPGPEATAVPSGLLRFVIVMFLVAGGLTAGVVWRMVAARHRDSVLVATVDPDGPPPGEPPSAFIAPSSWTDVLPSPLPSRPVPVPSHSRRAPPATPGPTRGPIKAVPGPGLPPSPRAKGRGPSLPPTFRNPIDDSLMVLIPEGPFEQGSEVLTDAHPVRTVWVSAFYMDVYECTNAQFAQFVGATGTQSLAERMGRGHTFINGKMKAFVGLDWRHPRGTQDHLKGRMLHPVVQMSHDDATEYCRWAHKRLPTEAEWEKAARGLFVGRPFPWGDEMPQDRAAVERTVNQGTQQVGSYPPNQLGLCDMAGNAQEWCLDWFDPDAYSSPISRDPGLAESAQDGGRYSYDRVLRGGGYFGPWSDSQVASRGRQAGGTYSDFTTGFRGVIPATDVLERIRALPSKSQGSLAPESFQGPQSLPQVKGRR